MNIFKCKILNKNGNIIDKYVLAQSEQCLPKDFNHSGILISVRECKSQIRNPYKDFTIPFLRNLAQLVKNKFDLVLSLEITSKTFNSQEAVLIVQYIIADIKNGASFSNALSKFSRYFDIFTVKTIEIAEQTAHLSEALASIIDYLEETTKLKQKIKNAIRYPIILLICVGFVFLFWLFVIVPKFAELFSEMAVPLPFYTKIIINISNFLIEYGIYILGLLPLCLVFFIKRLNLSKFILKIPLISKIKQKLLILNFFRVIDIMTSEKINLIDSLHSLERQYPEVNDVIKLINEGNSFSKALVKAHIFPNFDVAILETAERSGNLHSAFQTIISLTQANIENKINNTLQLFPTFAICVIGILLIIIVCSLIIPIYSSVDICF